MARVAERRSAATLANLCRYANLQTIRRADGADACLHATTAGEYLHAFLVVAEQRRARKRRIHRKIESTATIASKLLSALNRLQDVGASIVYLLAIAATGTTAEHAVEADALPPPHRRRAAAAADDADAYRRDAERGGARRDRGDCHQLALQLRKSLRLRYLRC